MDGKEGGKPSGPPGEELSRDDVRAQREAKKAAKAARKNKNLDKAASGGGDGGGTEPAGGSTNPSPAAPVPAASVVTTPAPKKEEPQGAEMSREEVMAQRAEKKKLKEARKGKSGGGGGGVGPDENKSKSNEQQRPKEQKQPSEGVKETQEKPQQKPTADPVKASNKPQQKQQNVPAGDTEKPKASEAPGTTKSKKAPSPDTTTTGAVGDSKVAVSVGPEKPAGKQVIEYQSTIHSLFRAKKTGESVKDGKFSLHPLFHSLGVKLRTNVIRGTNLRCTRLLHAIKDFVECYETPSGSTLKHGLSADLKANVDNLRRKCPFAIGMNNAVDFVNAYLYELAEESNDTEQKGNVMEMIDTYIEEKIEKAVEAIVMYGLEKIKSGDVIMIYSITEALLQLLQKAAEEQHTFELIIIQTPENMPDIPILLEKLSEPIKKQSVKISSVNFSNAIYRMRHCSKVIIGGHGLFTTGGVMAQSGSGKLALLAATYNKPAVFLCETYKFCDRSPLDFFTLDEYVPEHSEVEEDLFEPKIKYDVTPANLVTVVITDIDVLPSTSVPVVLRVQEGRSPQTNAECTE